MKVIATDIAGVFIIEPRDFLYKTTDYYCPEHERSLLWNDLAIGISWPLERGRDPVVSEKDKNAAKLAQADVFC